jgi:diaminopimelate decarboxylase
VISPASSSLAVALDTVRRLADHPTPFYVLDLSVFRNRVAELKSALPRGSRLLYSAKANPAPELLAAAASEHCGVEVASLGELRLTLEAGVPADDILIVGPAKSDAFLAAAVEGGVGTVVVESLAETVRLARVAADRMDEVRVAVRLNVPGARGRLRMSGHQFGTDLEESLRCVGRLGREPLLRFVGYHAYLASQLLDASEVVHNCRIAVERAAELTMRTGVPPELMDLGGGFGIPYGTEDPELNLDQLAAGLDAVVAEGNSELGSSWTFESGRFLAGPAGALVCRVTEVKEVDGIRFVLLDGGTNTSGTFGVAESMRRPRLTVLREGAVVQGERLAHLCGPLCTPMDRLASSVPTGAEAGDLIVWWNRGAYGPTAAPTAFLSFDPPAQLVVSGP